ncbi:MAG: bifunctional diguanylate cyclase/phosphodiesterase [Burkholderiales bacterium]|nr:bifunctional diguanylate cyclase/phosphodiesterase [Burkholderiales bacterium]
MTRYRMAAETLKNLLGFSEKDIFTVADRRRYVRIVVCLALPVTLVFSLVNYLQFGYPVLGVIEAVLALGLLAPAFPLSASDQLIAATETMIAVYGLAITAALSFFGGLHGSGVLWIFTFPFLVFWLKGQKKGLQWNAVWILLMSFVLRNAARYPQGYAYDAQYVEQLVSAMVFYTCIALAFNYSRTRFEERLHERVQSNTAKAEEYLARLHSVAYQDAVTGLPNRVRLAEILAGEIEQARRQHRSLLIVNIRLKRMFEISNILGVAGSDRLIRAIAATMVAAVGERGIFARVRRDEFICVYRSRSEDWNASKIIKEVLAFRLEYKINDYPVHIEHTVGIACYPRHAGDAEALLKKAEQAMLQAQFANLELAFYDERLEQQFVRRHLLFGQLHDALQKGGLSLHYQGQIDMATGAVIGAEALARWQDTVMGAVSPAEFIPVAEKSGLIKPFTLWVLREAFSQLARWRAAGIDICVSVNLSARSVIDPDLVPDLRRLLREFEVPPQSVTLELTESSFANSPEVAMETIQRLHELGFKQAIDDFGTGYSSLSYLKNLQVDELKIDQSFVRTLASDAGSRAIVQSTIQLAHNLNLKVVAEGIESERESQQLGELGCDVGQGYFFCKPMPAPAFQLWVLAWQEKSRGAARN